VEGLRNEVVVRDNTAEQLFPNVDPLDYRTSVEKALERLDLGDVETRWTDALASSQGDSPAVVIKNQEGMILEQRQSLVEASQNQVYSLYTSLGGERGWLFFNWAWEIRGLMDRIVGGVGLRRGRRDPKEVRVGDAVDFWRVEAVVPGELLRLRAEMKVPGRAWLQFDSIPITKSETQLVQTAFCDPKGLTGFLYWYLLYPIHSLIFSGLIREIKSRAEAG
jgi:hypothetical protein